MASHPLRFPNSRVPAILALAFGSGLMMPSDLGAQPARQAPLLHYRLEEGSGADIKDEGTLGWPLRVGSGLGWSLPGEGVGDGFSLGRITEEETTAGNREVSKDLSGLASFTWTGWFRTRDLNQGSGAIVHLVPEEGRGMRVIFATRARGDDRRFTLLLAVTEAGTKLGSGEGIMYAPWEMPYTNLEEWVFFAIAVDLHSSPGTISFYAGTEKKPVVRGGVFAVDESTKPAFKPGKITGILLADQDADSAREPIAVGTSLDDLRFYGSFENQSGALRPFELEKIRREALKPAEETPKAE